MWGWRDGQERLGEYSCVRDLVDKKSWAERTRGTPKQLLECGRLVGSNVMRGREGPLWLDWFTLRKDFLSPLRFTPGICYLF